MLIKANTARVTQHDSSRGARTRSEQNNALERQNDADTMTQAQNKANCLLLRGGRTLAATVDAYLTLPPTLNSHDRTAVVVLNTNFSTCLLLRGGQTLAATVDAHLTLPPTLIGHDRTAVVVLNTNFSTCLLLQGGRTLAATVDARLTLPPTLIGHDRTAVVVLNTNFSTCLLLWGGRTLAATVDAYITLPPTLNSHDRTAVVISSTQTLAPGCCCGVDGLLPQQWTLISRQNCCSNFLNTNFSTCLLLQGGWTLAATVDAYITLPPTLNSHDRTAVVISSTQTLAPGCCCGVDGLLPQQWTLISRQNCCSNFLNTNFSTCLLLRGGRTLAATVDAYITLPPTLNSHDRTAVVIFSTETLAPACCWCSC